MKYIGTASLVLLEEIFDLRMAKKYGLDTTYKFLSNSDEFN